MMALHPRFGVFKVAQQVRMTGTVAAPDSPCAWAITAEVGNVLLADEVLDRHDDRAASGRISSATSGSPPATKRVE